MTGVAFSRPLSLFLSPSSRLTVHPSLSPLSLSSLPLSLLSLRPSPLLSSRAIRTVRDEVTSGSLDLKVLPASPSAFPSDRTSSNVAAAVAGLAAGAEETETGRSHVVVFVAW